MFENIVVQQSFNGSWSKRVSCTMQELETIHHNHRKIGVCEVVFDIDCHIPVIYNGVWDRISTRLQKDNIAHQCWFTSRSPHIHVFFKDLNLFPKEVRRVIRLFILKHYSQEDFKWIDKGKCSEEVMIRDFNSIHEVTGKRKELIYEFINL